MNESMFFNSDKFAKYRENATKKTSFSTGAAQISAGSNKIDRWEMKSNSDCLMVVPLFLHLPFNIFTGEKLATPQPVDGTIRTAIRNLKYSASITPAVKEAMLDVLGKDAENILDLTNPVISDEEYKLFAPFRHQLVYAATVMSVRPANSSFAYGSPTRVKIAYDEESGQYVDSPNNPLIWKLYQMETAAISVMVRELREANEHAGDARRTDAELKSTTDNLWESRCIKNPYALGTSRVLSLLTNRNCEIADTITASWQKDLKSLLKYEYYIKCNKLIISTFADFIGSKYDRYEDFLLVKVHTPEFTDDTKGTAAQGINRSAAGQDDAIEKMLPDFLKVYAEYRDNEDIWDETVIMKSAYEYRTKSDDVIRDIFKQSLPLLDAALHTSAVFDMYNETLALVDKTRADELMALAMTDDLKTGAPITKELLAEEVRVDEDTKGYGGDSMFTADESIMGDTMARDIMQAALIVD